VRLKEVIQSFLPQGSFIKNVATLMTGTVFAQMLLILAAPILTRLYNPEEFGIFTLYTSVVGFMTVIACLRYEYAIVLPDNDEDAANLLALSIIICLGMTVIVFFLVAVSRNSFADLLGSAALAHWLWFVPLSVIAAGGFVVLNYWSTRRKQFKRLALRQVTNSTVTLFTQIGSGVVWNPGPGGLIAGHVIGQLTATGRLAWQIFRDEGSRILLAVNKKTMKQMLIRYRRFPLYDLWAGLINKASSLIPSLLLAYYFNPTIVGFYALAQSVLTLPISVIGGAALQVYFPRATEARRVGDLDRLTLNMFRELLNLGTVPMILIAIVAPDLFSFVFGSQWYTAGEYVRWLCLWCLFQFISAPISTVYYVLEKQRDYLFFNAALMISGQICLVVGGMQGDALFTIKLFGLSSFLIYVYFGFKIMIMSGNTLLDTGMVLLSSIRRAIPFIVPLLAYMAIAEDSTTSVILAIVIGLIFLGIKVRSLGIS